MDEPLAGIRVVELSAGLVVPAAGAILGDLGAEVIKIEPPGGHPERMDRGRAGPEVGDHCLPFALHNR
ncbi:MAG: CoA transferase, partial [Pseudomonadales bacterium]